MICRFSFACRSAWEDSRQFRLRTVQADDLFAILVSWAGIFGQSLACRVLIRNPALWTVGGGSRLELRESGTAKQVTQNLSPPRGEPGNVYKPLQLSLRDPKRLDLKPHDNQPLGLGCLGKGVFLGEVL